jgi:hypothetical protein
MSTTQLEPGIERVASKHDIESKWGLERESLKNAYGGHVCIEVLGGIYL